MAEKAKRNISHMGACTSSKRKNKAMLRSEKHNEKRKANLGKRYPGGGN